MGYVAWFEDLDKNSIPIAGGKGANLGELTKAGFPVPPGFVISAQAYKFFLDSTGIRSEINEILSGLDVNDNDALQKASKQIQVIITSEEVPNQIKLELLKAYENLMHGKRFEGLQNKQLDLINASKTKEPFVAVRSSATAEDLPQASFAGQQASFLNVKGTDDLVKAVRNCWASLFTARAIYYRVKNNFAHDKVAIAVIVQKMIDSEKSGVAFSIHPATGNKDEIVIEGGFGLGEYIVLGVINPNNYVVDKNTLAIKNKIIKRQTKMLTRDPLTGKNIEVDIPEQKQERQVLDDEQIITLAKVIKKIEQHYGFPQDIEWASENNRLYIVQSRPVTFFGKGEEVKTETSNEILVRGLSASPGKATGRVVIIHDASELDKITKGDILVTEMTNPDMVPAMERAAGIITNEGGLTSHAAIVSRELGVPCIVGTSNATTKLVNGMMVTLEASSGIAYRASGNNSMPQVAVIPEKPKTVDVKNIWNQVAQASLTGGAPLNVAESVERKIGYSVTGTKIYMNLGIPDKIDDYIDLSFDGIGLMRVEFIIASDIKMHPLYAIKEGTSQDYVDKLAEGIAKVAGKIRPRPIIIRFSDFKTNEYADLEGGKDFEPHEGNPMIGWRGVSRYISPEFEPAFRLECKAIKKVRDAGLTNVWVMLPFVRLTDEVKKVEEIMTSEGLVRSNDFKMLIMAEVPSVIIQADEFSKLCDGFSIGSNDLTQLTFGVDRDSSKLGLMGYFDERTTALKESIKRLIRAAHENGVHVGICGQAPSEYPEFTEFLIEAGIDSVSVNPDVINQTRELVASVEKRILLKIERKELTNEQKRLLDAHASNETHEETKDAYVELKEQEKNEEPTEDTFNSFVSEDKNKKSLLKDEDENKVMFWP